MSTLISGYFHTGLGGKIGVSSPILWKAWVPKTTNIFATITCRGLCPNLREKLRLYGRFKAIKTSKCCLSCS